MTTRLILTAPCEFAILPGVTVICSALTCKERIIADPFSLEEIGVTVAEILRNVPPSSLYEHAIRYENDALIAENGAL